ncbi:MAG: GAF domain-containing protein [Bacteriovoracaceae bacterium]|nr:GAF domain-containing protein [Bacteriovoracaceae bacterium]
MRSAPLPENEEKRLRSLKELDILDTAIEASFDEITQLAAQICETPISLISLLDEERQWFKSRYGLEAESTPRDYAFCGHTILQNEIFEVNDSRENNNFKDNPLVTGAPNVIFYAGSPLLTPDNLALGTLCVIDNKPKKLNEFQKKSLKVLTKQVSIQFELRRSISKIASARANEGALAMAVSYSHEINNPLMIAMGLLSNQRNKMDPRDYEKISGAHSRIAEAVSKITKSLKENGIELEQYSEKIKMLKL